MLANLAATSAVKRGAIFGSLAGAAPFAAAFLGSAQMNVFALLFVADLGLLYVAGVLLRSESECDSPRVNEYMFLVLAAALLAATLFCSPVPYWIGAERPSRRLILLGLSAGATLSGFGFAYGAGRIRAEA